jgi:hypothetical protein
MLSLIAKNLNVEDNKAFKYYSVFVRISVRLSFIMSERLIDATSILHCELEAPPV